jgi:hypothetical protein
VFLQEDQLKADHFGDLVQELTAGLGRVGGISHVGDLPWSDRPGMRRAGQRGHGNGGLHDAGG